MKLKHIIILLILGSVLSIVGFTLITSASSAKNLGALISCTGILINIVSLGLIAVQEENRMEQI